MDIIFTHIERGVQKTSNQGNAYTVNIIHGTKFYQGQESPYEKQYFSNNDDLNNVFYNIQPGTKVRLSFSNDRFKSLASAEVIGTTAPAVPAPQTGPAVPNVPSTTAAPSPVPYTPYPVAPKDNKFRDPAEIIRTDALAQAMLLISSALAAPEQYSKLIKKTATLESIHTLAISFAAANERFINGTDKVSDPESSAEEMTGGEENVAQPEIPA